MLYSTFASIPVALAALAVSAVATPIQRQTPRAIDDMRRLNARFVGGPLDQVIMTNGTLPTGAREVLERHHQLQKRDTADGTVSCRDISNDDFKGLNDNQLTDFLTRMNNYFSTPVYSLGGDQNIRKFRDVAFNGGGEDGLNAAVQVMPDNFLLDYPSLTRAQVCLDASGATTTGYQEDSGSCFASSLKTYGTLGDQGQVNIEVTQGYTLSASVSSETSNTFGTSLSVTVGADFEVASVEATVEVSYETSTTHGTENVSEQSSETTVGVTINPPAGYSCYMEITQKTCPGTMDITIPFTVPSGYIFVHYDPTSGTQANPNEKHYYYFLWAPEFLGGLAENNLVQHIKASVGSQGSYHQYCTANAIGSSDSSTGGGISTAYVPELTCPKNLGVIQGACSYTLEDYLGTGDITGDEGNWAFNDAVIEQFPGAGTSVPFGQSTVTFNVSTPYHFKSCNSLLQVTPPFGATFLPESDVLDYPSDNSAISAGYSVGYVSSCSRSQHGNCYVSDITSRYTKDFSWSLTSDEGNPIQTFDFSGTWPETDRLTFTLQCSDVYGNTGKVLAYQTAVRGDIATETLTANTATQTFHSTTQYLYTSVKTFLTSVVTPATTATLKTDTLYTGTSYTSTRTITDYGAPGFAKTLHPTTTSTSTIHKTRTLHPTITPGTVTLSLIETLRPTSTLTIERNKGVKTVLATFTQPHSKTITVKAAPTKCPKRAGSNAKQIIDARNIVSTTTVIDKSDTATIVDYTDLATTTVDATTTSTDLNDVYSTTLATTNTVYDPIDTAITSGIKYDVSTRLLESFTITRTSTRTSTTTTSTTRTKTSPSTAGTATSTSFYSTKTKYSTATAYKNKPTSTSTLYVKTVQGSNTVTHTVTKPAACTP